MSEAKKQNENRRFIAKIKEIEGSNGTFEKIYIENPNPTKEDGSANEYYKGSLMWYDAKEGKYYAVKQIAVRGVSEGARAHGFKNSLSIDLDSSYEVQEQS